MIPYDESGMKAAVGTVLKPWLEEHVAGGTFGSFDGTQIRYYSAVRPDAKAVIVMVHGFCEFFGKFHETAYDFWEMGYSVYFIEQRGHGGSGRSVAEADLVYVKDFSEYVEDLKCFLDRVVLPATPDLRTHAGIGRSMEQAVPENAGRKNLILYAHSMGGCVGGLFLEQHPEYFTAAVLSSPMLKMKLDSIPPWQVYLMTAAARLPGQAKKPMPGAVRFDPEKPGFEESGSSSRARFDYQFDIRKDPATGGIYTTNRATFGWARAAMAATVQVRKEAGRIRVPVLVCQAGKDIYVDNEGQDEFVRKVKYVKLVYFPEAEHEIYACEEETLKKYYRELGRFFDKAAGVKGR